MDGVIVGFISIGLITTINLAISAFNYGKLSQTVLDLLRRMDIEERRQIDAPPCSFHTELDKRVVKVEGQVETHLAKGN